MLKVPAFLLRKLYVRGTLRNTAAGIEFRLRNDLGSGYAEAMLPPSLDGRELPLESCFFSEPEDSQGPGLAVDGRRRFDRVSKDAPFCLPLNCETAITIENVTMSDGPHRIEFGFRVPGLGDLRFDFEDVPAGTR